MGRVEEISLIVISLWDLRQLILPISYFLSASIARRVAITLGLAPSTGKLSSG